MIVIIFLLNYGGFNKDHAVQEIFIDGLALIQRLKGEIGLTAFVFIEVAKFIGFLKGLIYFIQK